MIKFCIAVGDYANYSVVYVTTCRPQDQGSYDKGNAAHDQGPTSLDPGGDIQVSSFNSHQGELMLNILVVQLGRNS